MTPTLSIPWLGSEFDDFLFAPVGDDRKGMTVSVLSALARLDVDPREEAASLAKLPGGSAIDRLTSLLALLPGGIAANPDPRTIAARLIPLLRRRPAPEIAAQQTKPIAGTMNGLPTGARTVMISVLFVILMLGAQWIVTRNHPAAPDADGHAGASDTNAAQGPSRDSGR